MSTLILAAAALCAAALMVLLRPWWLAHLSARRGPSDAETLSALNTAIYRDQLLELERDRGVGQLTEDDYREARDELQRRLLDDTRSTPAVAAVGGGRAVWLLLALALPLGATAIYMLIGKPEAVLSSGQQAERAAQNMEKVTADLAEKLAAKPDNPEGWVMLARSYAAMERWPEAEKAIERIGPELDKNPNLLTAVADLLLRKTDGDFNGRPRELIAKALALSPEHEMALYLAGADALDRRDWRQVLRYWEPLLKQLEPGSDDAKMISAGVDRAREELRAGASKLGAGKAAPGSISGRLELTPPLKARAKPDDIVFLFALAEGGERMPLAAQRLRVADLPMDFVLSDQHALGGAKLSAAKAVRIEARVPKSGTPTASPGDFGGQSAIVKPGARGVRVLIDTELK